MAGGAAKPQYQITVYTTCTKTVRSFKKWYVSASRFSVAVRGYERAWIVLVQAYLMCSIG